MDDDRKAVGLMPDRQKFAGPRGGFASTLAANPPPLSPLGGAETDAPESVDEAFGPANGSYELFKLPSRYEMPELELEEVSGRKHAIPYVLIDWKDFDGDTLVIYHPRFTAKLVGRNLSAIFEAMMRKRVKRIWEVPSMKDRPEAFDGTASVVHEIKVEPTK